MRSTIGLKAVMAVTGAVLLTFVVAHAAGDLKFFAGPKAFDGYAEWLRTIGSPVLGHGWYLWVQRAVLCACVAGHIAAATALTVRDKRARLVRYRHRPRATTGYAARTMRWSGVIVGLFVVYHVLDVSAAGGHPYHHLAQGFRHWYVSAAYVAAVVVFGFHLRHGIHAAVRSLGGPGARTLAATTAVGVTAAFLAVPLAVVTGVAS